MKLFLAMLSFFFSSQLLAINTYCSINDDDQLVFEISNILTNRLYDAIFSVYSTGSSKKVSLNNQSKYIYTTAKKFYDHTKPQQIDLIIPNYFGSNENYSYSCYYVPKQNPNSQNENLIQASTAPNSIEKQKIENYADQQARTVANRIVNSFGGQENYKFNFVKGLKQGYTTAKVFTLVNNSYSQGVLAGEAEGKSKGKKIGQDHAFKEANQRAKQIAVSRHRQAITQGFIDYSIQIPQNVFVASKIADDVFNLEKNYQERIKLIDSDLRVELKKNTFGKDFVVNFQFDENFSITRWLAMDGKYKYVDSYFADEHALNEWKRNGLGGKYDYALYQKMNLTERSAFENHFKSIYRNVINEKLDKKIQEPNNDAFQRGVVWGNKIGNDESYLNGFKNGLEKKLEKYAFKKFNELFPGYFSTYFMHWMQYFNSNLAFDIEANLIPSSQQAGYFTLTGKIINYSGVEDFNLPLTLTSRVLDQTQLVQVPAIKPHSVEHFAFEDILHIKDDMLADKNYEVVVEIANQKQTVWIHVNFNYLLEQYISINDANSQQILKLSILETIKNEWNNNHGTFDEDIYQASLNNLNKSYLGQLVLFNQNNSQSKLTGLYRDIIKLNRSGSWLHFNKNKSFISLLEKLN